MPILSLSSTGITEKIRLCVVPVAIYGLLQMETQKAQTDNKQTNNQSLNVCHDM
jgi:hypothetical protein